MKGTKLLLLGALGGLLLVSVAMVQEKSSLAAAAGPVTVEQGKFPLNLKAGEYDLLTIILDFPKGSGVPKHKHGGYALVTVLAGEMTLKTESGEKTIKAGASWTEIPGAVHSVVNAGAAPARVVVNLLLPKGAEATTIIKE
jgi:quercetin dioxygenase-like cupin family protein